MTQQTTRPKVETWHGEIDGKFQRRTKLTFECDGNIVGLLLDHDAAKDLACRISGNAGFIFRGEIFLPEGATVIDMPFLPRTKPATVAVTATRAGDTDLARHVKAQLEHDPHWMPTYTGSPLPDDGEME